MGSTSVRSRPFLYAFREREHILDLFEDVCGARLTYSYITIGGVHDDLPAGWTVRCRNFLEYLKPRIPEYHALLTDNHIFVKRTAGIGVLSKEMALSYGCTGPMLRGSLDRTKGDPAWDLRKTEPYSGYEEYTFDVPVPPFDSAPSGAVIGDCWHRFYVRMREVVESIKIVEQAMAKYEAIHAEGEKVKADFAAKKPTLAADEVKKSDAALAELMKTKYSHRIEPPRTLAGGRVLRRDRVPARPDGLPRRRPAEQGERAATRAGAVGVLLQPERDERTLPRLPDRRRAGDCGERGRGDGGDRSVILIAATRLKNILKLNW